jgi:hypothetical protein
MYHDFEKIVYDGYKTNKVVFPNILNFSFLYDDEPATPTSLRKWSINRYLGFYLDDLELVKYISPYELPKIKSDVIIDNNNLLSSPSSESPFLETWKKEDFPYIEIGGKFYKIENYLEEGESVLTRVQISSNTFEEVLQAPLTSKWKIISEENLSGRQSEINRNLIKIEYINGNNILKFSDGSDFEIDGFNDADVWLIQIGDLYHKLLKVGSEFRIFTDYAFYQTLSKFDYYINDPDPKYRKTIPLFVDEQNEPVKFGVYRCNFTEIKDFDYNIVETDYSKFEYIVKNELTRTDEAKMYSTNWDSEGSPKDLDEFKLNGFITTIPTSSEYTATSETFRIVDNDLTSLWKKNPQRVKWGFQNSISSNDYPYLLNNCFQSGKYNRTVNTLLSKPSRQEGNLDYFLTINPDSDRYTHHSLHVVDDEVITYSSISNSSSYLTLNGISNIGSFNIRDKVRVNNSDSFIISIDPITNSIRTNIQFTSTFPSTGTIRNLTRTNFALDRYLNRGYEGDYFTYFFGKKTSFESGDIKKTTKKWSVFNESDSSLPNITLFRGIKYLISEVNSIKINNNGIQGINIKNRNTYKDWKFAVLASTNNFSLKRNIDDSIQLEYVNSNMMWQQIEEWRSDKIYATGSVVVLNDLLYQSINQSLITDPTVFPYNSSDWIGVTGSIFFSVAQDGTNATSANNMAGLSSLGNLPPLVYNNNEYYYSSGTTGINFWNPTSSYLVNDSVFFKGKVWKANADNLGITPNSSSYFDNNGIRTLYWSENTIDQSIWSRVSLWSQSEIYENGNSTWGGSFDRGHYVLHNDVVWFTNTTTSRGVEPQNDSAWTRIYSLESDTNFQYTTSFNDLGNPIIRMNNRLYKLKETIISSQITALNKTLDNGITIYVNKKWKNILVNIYVNDNSFTSTETINGYNVYSRDYLSNVNRDSLYSDVFEKLSADNFITSLNDFQNLYNFSDKIKYVIIEEDLSIKIFDFNDLETIEDLPVLLNCQTPDIFKTRIFSNIVESSSLSLSQIKAKKELVDSNISSIGELNYYDGKHLGVTIMKNETDPTLIPNYSKLQNKIYTELARYSGYYSPIFNKIELFSAPGLTSGDGNYKFDTDLTYFGQIRERIFSKVSRRGNILKLRNKGNLKSIYPMLDEFGYQTDNFFIFKSTWDYEYHVECNELPKDIILINNQTLNYNPSQVRQNNSESEL